jgi:hypothetical protein
LVAANEQQNLDSVTLIGALTGVGEDGEITFKMSMASSRFE